MSVLFRLSSVLLFSLALLGLSGGGAQAQEFNATVVINSQQVQNVDPQVFQQMERDIRDYLVNTRFTEHVFLPEERIRMQLIITVNRAPSVDRFETTMTISCKRPVYNSTYETLAYRFQDDLANFNYVPFQPLQYSENTFVSNLTSLLNFHALMALGFDYDTFSQSGGVPYFQRARDVLNLAVNGGEVGWQAIDGTQTRYWMAENILNNSYGALHEIYYAYHRQGLDVMYEDLDAGRKAIMGAIEKLNALFVQNPNIYMNRVFLDAKWQELIDIMKGGFAEDKQKFIRIMQQLDARRIDKYGQVLTASSN